MFIPVFIMEYFLPKTIWYLLLEFGTGIVIYFAALLILRVDFVYEYLKIYGNKIKSKLKKKQTTENETKEMDNDTDNEE